MAPNVKLTADMLADLEVPHEVKLSPSGSHVVYTLRADWNRPKGRWTSSLWIAEVGKQYSARKVTSGNSNDSWPQWHPDGKSVAFLSDSAKEGVAAIWALSLDPEAKPIPLTSTNSEKSIAKFAWSHDGKHIAYLSPDESTAERKAKQERKDDAKVYGEHWEYGRLRLLDLSTGTSTVLVSKDRHVYDFAWSPDSGNIAYTMQKTPEYEIEWVSGSSFETIQLADGTVSKLIDVGGSIQDLCWVEDTLWWRANYTMDKAKSSRVVYKMSLATKEYERYGYGEHDCATTWAFPPGLVPLSKNKLAVQVLSGLSDQIHVIPEGTKIYDGSEEVRGWHVVMTGNKIVIAMVTSSADKPAEVYSIMDREAVCLSEHGKLVAELELATAECFYAKAKDGTGLDAVLVTPKDYDVPKPWPTVVLVHGGPYSRVSRGFDLPYFNWSAWFAAAGYAVFMPNYRGGSSHGEAFAAGVRGTAGMLDYSDTIDLVEAAVSAKIIDPNRVVIAGWSYGGYLSYLAVARDSIFRFQAAMCGAGLSDWDHTIMTSSGWRSAIEISGCGPWIGGVNNTHNREGSALWQMKDAKTPVLILHGEDDDIVPISQAQAFHHGCVHYGIPCELVVYPREGHGMFPPFERAHYIDMLERMKRFFDKHLSV